MGDYPETLRSSGTVSCWVMDGLGCILLASVVCPSSNWLVESETLAWCCQNYFGCFKISPLQNPPTKHSYVEQLRQGKFPLTGIQLRQV
jgi:hypothetical protein